MKYRTWLLIVEGAISLGLGGLLAVLPRTVLRFLGAPEPESAFYPSVLGAVLAGIGIALLIQALRPRGPAEGLGSLGAASINLCGAVVLGAWLVGGALVLSVRGFCILWGLTALLMLLSAVELGGRFRGS